MNFEHLLNQLKYINLKIKLLSECKRTSNFIFKLVVPKISNFIHKLTGITDKDIATGVTWTEAINLFNDFIIKHDCNSQNSTIVTCGKELIKF